MSKQTKTIVTAEFLVNKLGGPNTEYGGFKYKASTSNLSRISDSVYSFTEYNFLPGTECILDGHYTFFVNVDTFEYMLYKSSDYGSFNYVTEFPFAGFLTKENMPQYTIERVEGTIASKLLYAYFYDSQHVNHRGANLIPGADDTHMKMTLITDYRGDVWSGCKPQQYDPQELVALKHLCGFTPPDIKDFTPEQISEIASKFNNRKTGKHQLHPLVIDGVEYTLIHRVNEIYGKVSGLMLDKKLISQEILDHKLKDFVTIIPTILRNYAN